MSIACHSFAATSVHASIKPMQRCGVDMLDFGPETDAQQAARIVASGDTSPYLYVSHPVGEGGAHSVFAQDVYSVAANGFDLSYFAPKYGSLFGTFSGGGITPAKMIFDLEGGPDYEGLMGGTATNANRLATMQGFYGNPTTVSRMTAAMRALAAVDFVNYGAHYAEWINWFNEFQCAALRSIRDIARTSFGNANLVATNWGDVSGHHFVPLDIDGSPQAETSVTVGWSAPICYFDLGKVTNPPLTKHRFWNLLINILNHIRAATTTQITAWIPNGLYQSDLQGFGVRVSDAFCIWLWEQMVRLMVEAGCTDLIFWNPNAVTAENSRMDAINTSYAGQTFTPISGLSAIALDANSITMGTRTLTYAEFLGMLNEKKSRRSRTSRIGSRCS